MKYIIGFVIGAGFVWVLHHRTATKEFVSRIETRGVEVIRVLSR